MYQTIDDDMIKKYSTTKDISPCPLNKPLPLLPLRPCRRHVTRQSRPAPGSVDLDPRPPLQLLVKVVDQTHNVDQARGNKRSFVLVFGAAAVAVVAPAVAATVAASTCDFVLFIILGTEMMFLLL